MSYDSLQLSSSDAAQRGTDLHKQAELAFNEQIEPVTAISAYVDYIRSLKYKSTHYALENAFSLNLTDEFTLQGAVDFCSLDEYKNAHIVDLKTGVLDVAPFSEQLLAYALLYRNFLETEHNISTNKIFAVVHQNDKVKKLDVTDLLDEFKADLIERCNDEIAHSSGDHCGWCSAILDCKLVQDSVNNLQDTLKSYDKITKNTKVEMNYSHLKNAKLINAYLDVLKKTFVEQNPERVEYSTRSIRTWINEDDENIPKVAVSVAKAAKMGYSDNSNIKTVQTKVIKGFKL